MQVSPLAPRVSAAPAAPAPVPAPIPAPAPSAPETPTKPSTALVVPQPITDALAGAAQVGRDESAKFLATHTADPWLLRSYVVQAAGFEPGPDVEQQELAELHALQDSRTPEGNAEMQEFDRHGTGAFWKGLVAESTLPDADKSRVSTLVDTALTFANDVAQTVKGATMRARPFVVDPTITPVGRVPGKNPSFPSGHSIAGFAAAEVLGMAMPERKAEFDELAQRIAFSRMYGGMHFRSDVVAGAKIGAMVGSFLSNR